MFQAFLKRCRERGGTKNGRSFLIFGLRFVSFCYLTFHVKLIEKSVAHCRWEPPRRFLKFNMSMWSSMCLVGKKEFIVIEWPVKFYFIFFYFAKRSKFYIIFAYQNDCIFFFLPARLIVLHLKIFPFFFLIFSFFNFNWFWIFLFLSLLILCVCVCACPLCVREYCRHPPVSFFVVGYLKSPSTHDTDHQTTRSPLFP